MYLRLQVVSILFIFSITSTHFVFFGEGYFAPVALNVLLSVGIAYFGAKLALAEFKMSKKTSRFFLLFLLFHPDILVWSSIANLKDMLVLLLHLILLVSVSQYLHGRFFKALMLALPAALVLLFLRFYVPLLFAIALAAGSLLANQRRRISYVIASLSLVTLALVWIGNSGLQYAINSFEESFVNPFYGVIRFVLTPIPFNTEKAYAFLDIPALFHWMLMPFMLLGLMKVIRMKTYFSRFFIMYFFVFIALYSTYEELQGARHRVQLDYAFALLQFTGIMISIRVLKRLTWHQTERYAE